DHQDQTEHPPHPRRHRVPPPPEGAVEQEGEEGEIEAGEEGGHSGTSFFDDPNAFDSGNHSVDSRFEQYEASVKRKPELSEVICHLHLSACPEQTSEARFGGGIRKSC